MDSSERTKSDLPLYAIYAVLLTGLYYAIKVSINIVNSPYFKSRSIPTVKCNQFLFYAAHMSLAYRLSRCQNINPFTIVNDGVLGLAKYLNEKGMFQLFLFFKPVVLCYKHEVIEAVLGHTTCINKAGEYNFLHPWLGTGLLTSGGDKWRNRRKLLTPSFHFNILQDFIPIFQEQSEILVSKLVALTHEPWVDIVPITTLCTLDIICETAMGVRINVQTGQNTDYVEANLLIGDSILNRLTRPWLYPDCIYKRTTMGKNFYHSLNLVQEFTKKVIREKKSEMLTRNGLNPASKEIVENGNCVYRKNRKAFLERMLELHFEDPTFTEEDIREEVDTFMFEGHDTTSLAISWSLYMLGLYPEIQKQVHNELDDILRDDPDRRLTREDLTEMKYLECVIKEALRLFPSVPQLGRYVTEDIKVQNHTIFAGSSCYVLPAVLHLDPESFPDPEKFQPERFFPENSVGRHPYAYVPFSAGPRNCIGQRFAIMEEKVIMANILRKIRVTSLDPRDRVHVAPLILTRNDKPLRLRLELR